MTHSKGDCNRFSSNNRSILNFFLDGNNFVICYSSALFKVCLVGNKTVDFDYRHGAAVASQLQVQFDKTEKWCEGREAEYVKVQVSM